jgi:hypothetical protein
MPRVRLCRKTRSSLWEKSGSTAELIGSMLSHYPHFGDPYTLWLGAQDQVTE